MKRAIRNVLGVAGLLLMIASLVWISFHQQNRPAVYKESKSTPPQTSKPFAVVVLDPGHGGKDSGAMCGGIMEKDLTLDIARRVDRLLDSEGVATLMTRVGDSYVSLADRAAFGNRAKEAFSSVFILTKTINRSRPAWKLTMLRIRSIQALLSLRGCRFFRGRRPIRPSPKAKASPVSFRKRWWHGPAPSTGGRRPNNFL